MKVIRTPDPRFENLSGYNFGPNYAVIESEDGTPLRIHYIDAGRRDADPILLMNGNPSWVYLYRKMIPGLLETGHRVMAVDLVGCERSDKPPLLYPGASVDWITKWMRALDLRNITLICQDWGGTVGLNIFATHSDRFSRVIASNTGLPCGDGANEVLRKWQRVMKFLPVLPFRFALKPSVRAADFSDEEFAAYKAPFPSRHYQAGSSFSAVAWYSPKITPAQRKIAKLWQNSVNLKSLSSRCTESTTRSAGATIASSRKSLLERKGRRTRVSQGTSLYPGRQACRVGC